jgi:hypothetical protein
VAFDAILKVSNAFLQMLGSDPVGLMLVAPVAGIPTVVIYRVTRRAWSVVVAFQREEFTMVKRGGFPALGAVTLTAASPDLSMQIVAGRLVATFASI